MTNNILWFNIGQKGSHYVTWQCAIIDVTFDPKSIKFEDCEWDEENNPHIKYVSKDELSYSFHHSVEDAFQDLEKVAEWVKESYESEMDIHVGGKNWLHIYDEFDMDDINEWGYGKAMWD